MASIEKAFFNWSGGKDSSLALYKTLKEGQFDVRYLLSNISEKYRRVSMHGIRESLLEQQAQSIGIPLLKMEIPEAADMISYEKRLEQTLHQFSAQAINTALFGDIFLEDLKKYREQQLQKLGIKAHFPLWQQNTSELIHEFLDLGFKTIVSCVNASYLDKSFVGRVIDKDFIKDLPGNVDPCGEHGEFHTFTFEGPLFKQSIPFELGEITEHSYPNPSKNEADYQFWFCDLIPTTQNGIKIE
jgi:uncharacterized protein (TIGR00290 family)